MTSTNATASGSAEEDLQLAFDLLELKLGVNQAFGVRAAVCLCWLPLLFAAAVCLCWLPLLVAAAGRG